MQESIKKAIEIIGNSKKPIKIISHNDTDGITSAAIFSRALYRSKIQFSLEIVKSLQTDFIKKLPEDHLLVFLDLASNHLETLSNKNTEAIILDHHELPEANIPKNITLINPLLSDQENICSAAICYLFATNLSEINIDLANLAVIGMVGDMHDSNLTKTYTKILNDAEVVVKKGLLLYPATRPLDRVLENSSSFYIPEVTGSFSGVLKLLKEAKIEKTSKGFKSISELTEEEMSNLITAIMLKKHQTKETKLPIGNIFLLKFQNRIEDAREISALINACSRMDYPDTALGLCLNSKEMQKEAEKIYTHYKKSISSALGQISSLITEKGSQYTIINAEDKIKDTIIGTIASIISFSPLYEKGTIIITMAYSDSETIKVSARLAGREGRNVREILVKATQNLEDFEVGGHPLAAGASIKKIDESQFIENLKNILEVELIKV